MTTMYGAAQTSCINSSSGLNKSWRVQANYTAATSTDTTYTAKTTNIKFEMRSSGTSWQPTVSYSWTSNGSPATSVSSTAKVGTSGSYSSGTTYNCNTTVYTVTYNRTCSAWTGHLYAKIWWKDKKSVTKTSTADYSFTVAARTLYTITYNANGGTLGSNTVSKCANCNGNHKAYGYNTTLSSVAPTRTGYTFSGWNTNAAGTGTNYAAGATYSANAGATLYAKWTEKTATLTYDASGISGATLPSNVTMKYTEATTAGTATPPSGYAFAGWATSEANAKAGTVAYAAGAQVKAANVIPSATTLYAVWKSTLSYDANGHGTAPSSSIMYYTPAATAEAAITASSYTFTGWNTVSDGSGTDYAPGDTVKAASTYKGDTTLYAQWLKLSKDFVKINGSWREVEKTYTKVNSVWREVTNTPIKVDGTWYRLN